MASMPPASYAAHDPILDDMTAFGCELKNGFSNHTPMVAEALAAMGESTAASVWFNSRKTTIKLRPTSKQDITIDQWQQALGQGDRFTDWMNFFKAAINKRGWQATAARWVPQLQPGFLSAAGHGAIRTGHAVRALKHQDTIARRRELAYALASWACTYATLRPATNDQEIEYGNYNGQQVLNTLPLLDPTVRKNDGAITTAVAQLRSHGSFFNAVDQLQFGEIKTATAGMAQSAASVFLHNVRSPLGAIVFTHAITGVAAAHHMLPLLAHNMQRALLFAAFNTICALHAVYATTPLANQTKASKSSVDDLIQQAVNHGDDHVIKLTESCLLFHEMTGDSNFFAAAELAATLIPAYEERTG